MTRKGVVKEHLYLCSAPNHLGDYTGRHFEEGVALQTNSSLGIAKEQEGAEEGRMTDMTDPHRWRGDGAWMRLKI